MHAYCASFEEFKRILVTPRLNVVKTALKFPFCFTHAHCAVAYQKDFDAPGDLIPLFSFK